jgi:hypothetical protein
VITTNDNILVPYVISAVPNYSDAAIMFVSVFMLTNEIKSAIQSLIEYTAGLAGEATVGQIIAISLRAVYIQVLLITAAKFIIDLFTLLVQPIKYHAAMNVLLQCQKAASFLGYTFSSSILEGDYKDMAILPTKNAQTTNSNKNDILGFLDKDKTKHKGFYKGTFGDLLRALKTTFKAKIIIDGNVIRLEREDYTTSTALYQIPDIDNSKFSLNGDEFISNYIVDFSVDYNDKNTVNEYTGTSVQVQTQPKTINNKGMVLTRGFENNAIPFALGKRKQVLTTPEKILRPLFKALDAVVNIFVKIVNLAIKLINALIKLYNKLIKALKTIGIKIKKPPLKPLKPVTVKSFVDVIDDRIGMLKMENDFISVPKLLMIPNSSNARDNSLLPSNETLLNADYLWENFHSIKSFDSETYNIHNQYVKRTLENVPFCFEDYEKVRENNKVIDSNGVDVGVIDSLEFIPSSETASIEFRINKVYTKNLKTTKIILDGK